MNNFDFELLIPISFFIVAGGIGLGAIIASVLRSSHREKTRREVAAYVAEGSITSEDAERMIRAWNSRGRSS